MDNQVKEIVEAPKKKGTRTLPIPFSGKAKKNLIQQQGRYMQKHGRKINLKNLGGLLLETATLPE